MNLFSFFKRSESIPKDSPLSELYLRHFEKRIPKMTPLRDLNFIVLDSETSGLDLKKDHLLSIAALKIRNFEIDIASRYEAFFLHDNYIPDDSVKVHGILSNHLKSGTSEKEILLKFLEFIQNGIIVGHHIGFDLAMINKSLKSQFGIQLRNKSLDTAVLAKRIENTFDRGGKPDSLDTLCERYNISLGKRHTASGDTFITALLFLKLLGRLERRGVKSLGRLMQ